MSAAARSDVSVTISTNGVDPVIALAGELDVATVGAVDVKLEPTVAATQGRLVFDLGGLRFMDSSGIALLLRVAGRVGEVRVRRPSPLIRQVIELMGLSDVLTIEP
jgi:anti-sigma B factor antagonist